MEAWWEGLSALNKVFALSALVFSILFIWQMIAALLGADTDSHMHTGDAGVDHSLDTHDHVHGSDALVTFTLISVRSLIAFGTLFSWSGALYLSAGTSPLLAILYSCFWGVLAMISVSYLLYTLLRLQERGNMDSWTAVGTEAVVYLDIPGEGIGQVRVSIGGVISFLKASSVEGLPLPAGTQVLVVGIGDNNVLEVKRLNEEISI
jgi:membrane protein implicated in regulation of membrane protease activity